MTRSAALKFLCGISLFVAVCWSNSSIADGNDKESKPRGSKSDSSEERQRPYDGPGFMMDLVFERLNSDGDDGISQDEFLAPMLQRFQRVDSNGDGLIDRSEMMAARETVARVLRPLFGFPGGLSNISQRDEPSSNEHVAGNQRPGDERIRQLMQRIQLDDQGRLVLDDLPEPMRQRLSQLDINADGFVDPSEGGQLLNRLQEARKQRDKKPGAKKPGKEKDKGQRDDDSHGPQKPKRPAEESRD